MQKSSYLENFDRRRNPSDSLWPQWFDFNELLRSDVSLFRNENGSRLRHLLQTIGEMHIRSSGIIGLVYSVFYRLNDNFACVNAYADLQIRIIQASYPVLHRKSGQAAADGMILMWLRRAKNRHHPVAL